MTKKENGKKIRFTVVDLIIVLVIAGGAAFACMKLIDFKPPSKRVTVDMTVINQSIKSEELPRFENNDKIYISDVSTETAGVITSQRVYPTVRYEKDTINGVFVESESPVMNTAEIGVTVEATEDDVNIECGDTTLKVGMQVVIKGDGGSFEGTIIELNSHE